MAAAVAAVEAEHGPVGALVNNAGYGVYGPVEEVAMDASGASSRPTCSGSGG